MLTRHGGNAVVCSRRNPVSDAAMSGSKKIPQSLRSFLRQGFVLFSIRAEFTPLAYSLLFP
jgi:hypothetical protein